MVEQTECARLAQHASDNIKENAVLHHIENEAGKEIAKLKREISTKNRLSMSMQNGLGAALQKLSETMKVLATTEDMKDMIFEVM